MLLAVKRNPSKDGATISELLADGLHEGWVCEDEIREPTEGRPSDPAELEAWVKTWKVAGKTAIPSGKYRIALTPSKRFGRVLPELLNVPGYAGVRMHPGNTPEQTEGCLLVGEEKTAKSVLRSREAMLELMAMLSGIIEAGEQVWISVENP